MNTTSTIQEQLASAEVVEWVQDWLRAKKGKSRTALARDVHTALNLKDARGQRRSQRRLGRRVAAPRNVPARVEQVQGLLPCGSRRRA